jgi:putative transposase
MSRPLRIALEDGWYHVINRGIERRSIFRSAADCRHFVELLAQLPERFGILIHCYALMPQSLSPLRSKLITSPGSV